MVVLGCKGVGKSTFIDECQVSVPYSPFRLNQAKLASVSVQQAAEDYEGKKRIEICGSKVAVKFVSAKNM